MRRCASACARSATTDPLASAAALRYARALMAERKVTDAATLLAELRERVHGLDERVTELGRHL
jgi:hypothetical protein